MTAVSKDLAVEQGATYTLFFQWCFEGNTPGTAGAPRDLTGWSVRMQVRKSQQSAILVEATTDNGKFKLGVDPATLDIDTGDPTVPADPTNGWIMLQLTDADTDLMTAKSALYDIEAESPAPDNKVYRLLQGNVTVSPNITQIATDPVVG